MPTYTFKLQSGDVLAFLYPLCHALFGGSSHCRMLEGNYYLVPTTLTAVVAFHNQMMDTHKHCAAKRWHMSPKH